MYIVKYWNERLYNIDFIELFDLNVNEKVYFGKI